MGVQIRRLLAVLAFGLVPLAPAGAQTTGTVQGRITDAAAGTPIVGALVELVASSGRIGASAVTNAEGRYRVTVEAGSYTLSISAVGYGTRRSQSVQVTAGSMATADAAIESVAFELNPLVVTASRKQEKALEAPARVEIVNEREIEARPALSPIDHLRSTPAVDVITSGLQSTNVVVRGFNNIFSGSLHALTDNRIAGVPSLRVNLMHFVPQTNDDFERMEVVLGPGSALYGPNTSSGVLHIITKSPLDRQGTTFSVSGGEKSVLHVTGRTAHRLSDRFGFKVSGQWFQGNDWEFRDPVEEAAKTQATTSFATWAATQPRDANGNPLSAAELQLRASRLAARDFAVKRWSLDSRADWRPTPEFGASLTAGWTSATSGVELTGIGAAQVQDWIYGYYQARFNYNRWFAQAYLNTSDAGDTYLLRTGAPIVDKSKVFVAQGQHLSSLGSSLELTYGGDFIRTMPATEGTINGSREDSDNFNQFGAYLQAKLVVSPKFDIVAAAREDWHSELEDPVFSPRAALVFKPSADHTLRGTYNRAFSTPSSLNLFLDIDGGPAGALGPLGFRVRAQGPGKAGIRLADGSGQPLGMRTPLQPGQLLAVNAGNVYDAQLALLIASLRANPATAGLVPLFQQLGPAIRGGALQIPLAQLNASTGQVGAFGPGVVQDVAGIKPSISTTYEAGYKGLIGERLLLAADVWFEEKTDFTSPLVLRTPLYLLSPQAFGAYLQTAAGPAIVQALVQAGLPLAQAQAQAGQLITSWVRIPGGVSSSADVAARGADLLATYVNFPGEVTLWGLDLSGQAILSDEWQLGLTYSHVSDHNFCLVDPPAGQQCPAAQLIALNAPKDKATASLGYRGASGFSAESRVRFTGEFPVNSADFIGLQCIGGGGQECVESFTLVDLTLGYRLPNLSGASVQLAVTNVFDEAYRSFVGVPTVGRLALLRLRYDF